MILQLLLPDGTVQALDLENYLRAVVPAELGARHPLEALKAQAIAARTFAVVALSRPRHKNAGAHLCTEVHCQAFRPSKIHPRTDQAINDTAGLIVTYHGRPAQTFYSARCGGHTRAAWYPSAAPWCQPVPCPCGALSLPPLGHRVGLCQLGAVLLAAEDHSTEEILRHYYTGIDIATSLSFLHYPDSFKSGHHALDPVLHDREARP